MTEGQEFKPGVPLRPKRVNVEVPVRYRPVGDDSWYVGRSENVSQVGLLIQVAHSVPLGAFIEGTMSLPTGLLPGIGGEMLFMGTVARHVPASGGPLRIGIAFRTLPRIADDGSLIKP